MFSKKHISKQTSFVWEKLSTSYSMLQRQKTPCQSITKLFKKWQKHRKEIIVKSHNNKYLMTGHEGFPRISMFPSASPLETLRFSGNKIYFLPRDQS